MYFTSLCKLQATPIMAAGKEFHCKPPEYAVDSPDVDEAEEVLSLSDVATAVDCDSFPSSSSLSSSSSSDHDLFEFSSGAEELTPSSPPPEAAENIIFCGKLIAPRSEANHRSPQNHEEERIKKIATHIKWIAAVRSTTNPKSNDLCPRGEAQKPLSRSKTSPASASIRRAQLKSSTVFRRRPSLWFGMARVPAEMDLCDIKRRQLRRNPSEVMRRSSSGDGGEGVSVRRKRVYGGGLWGLVKGLGCGGIGSTDVNSTLRVVSSV